MIETNGFNLAHYQPVSAAASGAAPKGEKHFPLEGVNDIYEGILGTQRSSRDGDPVFVTLGTKLFPALDALRETIGLLGKNPTPDEVDRSNVRRVIRAFQPIAEAFAPCYDDKDLKKAMEDITDLADSLGSYKDASVMAGVIAQVLPGGRISHRISRELEKEKEHRAEKFGEVYRHFRKKGMDRALGILFEPESASHMSPEKIARKDRRMMAAKVEDLASELKSFGLIHREPEDFHQARKNLRTFVYAAKASKDLFGFDGKDIVEMSNQTLSYGLAQDSYTAYRWLKKKGFEGEAKLVLARYHTQQEEALAGADKLVESGVIERMLQKLPR